MKLVKVRWYRNGHKLETWEFPEHNIGDAHDSDLETADFAVPHGWQKGFDRVNRPHMYGPALGEIGTDEAGNACIEYERGDGETVRIPLRRSANKVLYIACDNYTNYLYRRDFDRAEKDCQLCDFDLSKEEIKENYEKQEEQENRPSLFPWESYDEIRDRMNMMVTLEAYIKNME